MKFLQQPTTQSPSDGPTKPPVAEGNVATLAPTTQAPSRGPSESPSSSPTAVPTNSPSKNVSF